MLGRKKTWLKKWQKTRCVVDRQGTQPEKRQTGGQRECKQRVAALGFTSVNTFRQLWVRNGLEGEVKPTDRLGGYISWCRGEGTHDSDKIITNDMRGFHRKEASLSEKPHCCLGPSSLVTARAQTRNMVSSSVAVGFHYAMRESRKIYKVWANTFIFALIQIPLIWKAVKKQHTGDTDVDKMRRTWARDDTQFLSPCPHLCFHK